MASVSEQHHSADGQDAQGGGSGDSTASCPIRQQQAEVGVIHQLPAADQSSKKNRSAGAMPGFCMAKVLGAVRGTFRKLCRTTTTPLNVGEPSTKSMRCWVSMTAREKSLPSSSRSGSGVLLPLW